MSRKSSIFLITITLLLFSPACTIQGLPYPTTTPGLDARATQAEATREITEAGMFPSQTSEPRATTTPESLPAPTPTGRAFLIPSLTLKLAYIKEGNLWYWEEDQPPRQLTSQGDAALLALSDDASQVAFARELDYAIWELWAVKTDGSSARVLIDSAAFQDMKFYQEDLTAAPLQLDWLPGTDLVVFSTRIIDAGPGMQPRHELRSVNSSSRTMTVLADQDYGGKFSVSPDGSRIALSLPDQISLVNADGSGLRELYNFRHINTGSEWWYYPPLAWTLDSSAVRVVLPPEDPRADSEGLTRIIHLPADGSPARVLGQIQTIPVFYAEAILSPDAHQLAYVGPGPSEDPGAGILYTAPVNGSGATACDEGQITLYAWSPDNRHFLYSVNDLNKIGSTNAEAISLEVPGYIDKIRFVDPSHFLFVSWRENQQQLSVADLDGTVYSIAESSSELEYDFVR